jgi:hypothetical protein
MAECIRSGIGLLKNCMNYQFNLACRQRWVLSVKSWVTSSKAVFASKIERSTSSMEPPWVETKAPKTKTKTFLQTNNATEKVHLFYFHWNRHYFFSLPKVLGARELCKCRSVSSATTILPTAVKIGQCSSYLLWSENAGSKNVMFSSELILIWQRLQGCANLRVFFTTLQ